MTLKADYATWLRERAARAEGLDEPGALPYMRYQQQRDLKRWRERLAEHNRKTTYSASLLAKGEVA